MKIKTAVGSNIFLCILLTRLLVFQLCDYLESHFLTDSHDTIKKLGDYLGSLTRLVSSEPHGNMGEYLFDKHTL